MMTICYYYDKLFKNLAASVKMLAQKIVLSNEFSSNLQVFLRICAIISLVWMFLAEKPQIRI